MLSWTNYAITLYIGICWNQPNAENVDNCSLYKYDNTKLSMLFLSLCTHLFNITSPPAKELVVFAFLLVFVCLFVCYF